MKAATYSCYGSSKVIQLGQIDKPQAAENEVLVKVRSAGVNPLDWHYMRGSPYLMRLSSGIGAPSNQRLGVDFAGVVEAVGSEVTRFNVGDEVFGGATGAFAQYVTVRETSAIALKPANISFDQAASVGIAAVTALQALKDHGQLTAGQSVLINGASGGVGTFAVQIAHAMGAQVTGVSSARNHPLLRELGADQVIDYKQENYTLNGEHYDLIVDMIGNHSSLANSKVLKPTGRRIIVGGASGDWVGPFKGPLMAAIQSPLIEQETVMLMALLSNESIEEMAELMRSGDVVPILDRSFALEDVRAAITYSESGRARGKIVINQINSLASSDPG